MCKEKVWEGFQEMFGRGNETRTESDKNGGFPHNHALARAALCAPCKEDNLQAKTTT